MNRNTAIVAIFALALAAGALGYWMYQERQRPGVEISVGRGGVSIQGR